MKVAYFDCQFGAAGDMLNAALLAAGADEKQWRARLAKLGLKQGEFTAVVSDVMRCHLACKKLDVFDAHGQRFDEPTPVSAAAGHTHTHGHGHAHEHEHEHGHGHGDSHAHEHEHAHPHEPEHAPKQEHEHGLERLHDHGHEHAHRTPGDIEQLIRRSEIPPKAKDLSIRIFRRLARAEARVHGVKPEAVKFHEVGAVDAIVDIVGFCIAYELLGIQKSFASAVAIGSGKVRTQHGIYPVPGPATLYLLEEAGATIAPSIIDFECLTPTGAAILCEVVAEWGRQPQLSKMVATGYGGGTKDPPQWPNVCRVVVGEMQAETEGATARFDSDSVTVVEANIDDLNPQALAFAMERLLEAGALDVAVIPALMKKGRAGQLLSVICHEQNRALIEELILTQTSTIGVRHYQARRTIARREFAEVKLGGEERIRIKVAFDNRGKAINAQPEYEDCAAYALKHGLPVKDVINQALSKYFQSEND